MPFIDYYLTSDVEITKDKLSETELTRQILKRVELGSDNRTWNRKQLKALKLLLCNAITYINEDNERIILDINQSIEVKSDIIEHLWKIIISDNKIDQYESNLMRRICGLIYFPDHQSNKIRNEINSSFKSSFKKNKPAITAPDCPNTANHLK